MIMTGCIYECGLVLLSSHWNELFGQGIAHFNDSVCIIDFIAIFVKWAQSTSDAIYSIYYAVIISVVVVVGVEYEQ